MSCRPDSRALPGARLLRLALAAALATLAPAPGAANESGDRIELGSVDLDALLDLRVEAVTRREEPGTSAPASVFVLTADDLRRQGFRTLYEALRTVPGLFGYADGLYPSIGVRGVGLLTDYDTRLLVLVDGHPLNNSVGIGQSYVGRDLPVPIAAVRRIEVIEGPVGSVYGPTAFLGVVNVVTFEAGAAPDALHGGVEAVQGRAGGAEASLLASPGSGPIRATAAIAAWGTRGQDWTFPELTLGAGRPLPDGPRVRDTDDARARGAYLRLAYRELSANAGCGEYSRQIPTAPYEALVGDGRTTLGNRTCFVEAAWRRTPAAGLDLEARASYDDFAYDDAFAYAPPPRSYGVYGDRAWDRWASLDLRADLRADARTRLSAGVRGELHRTSQSTFADRPGVAIAPIREDFRTGNAFLLAERDVGPLRLHAGVTLYVHELFGAELTPKVAAILRATPRDVVKAIWSEGFRAPTMSEAFYDDGTSYLANPDLGPEKVVSGELVWERRVADAASLALAGFWSQYRDLIQYETVEVPGPGVRLRQTPRNVARLRTFGGQLSATVRLGELVTGWGGLSLQGSRGDRPANFPAVTGSAALSTRWPWRPLTLSANVAALSSRAKDPTALLPGERRDVPAAAVLSVAAALAVPTVPGLTVELAVQNLATAGGLSHPVAGDFAPLSELAEPAPTVRASLRWAP